MAPSYYSQNAARRFLQAWPAEIVWTNQAFGAIRKLVMAFSRNISRRTFMRSTSLATAGAVACHLGFPTSLAKPPIQQPLDELGYGDITLTSDQHEKQLHDTDALLMELSEDSLLKPFRGMKL